MHGGIGGPAGDSFVLYSIPPSFILMSLMSQLASSSLLSPDRQLLPQPMREITLSMHIGKILPVVDLRDRREKVLIHLQRENRSESL